MLPNDFRVSTLYGKGFDWPISYNDLERWYVDAEYEMGVAGSDAENTNYYQRRFGAFRSKPFPMPALAPSYLDKQVAAAINGKTLPGFRSVPLQVNTVPHAINSRTYDQRPACEGYTSCVPLCPIKARYEAIVHVEKALKAGATLRTKAVVTKLQLDDNGRNVTRVFYKRWDGTEDRASGRIIVLAANAHRKSTHPAVVRCRQSQRRGWTLLDGSPDQAILRARTATALSIPRTANDVGYRGVSRRTVPAPVCRLQDLDQERRLVERRGDHHLASRQRHSGGASRQAELGRHRPGFRRE